LVVVSGERDEQPSVDRVFDLRVDDHEEPLRELRRLHRLAAGYRRRNRIDETADPDEEREAALEAGLRPDEAALAALFAHARRGEADETVALIGELVDAEPLSMAAFERYEALGLMPPGLLDRVRSRGAPRLPAYRGAGSAARHGSSPAYAARADPASTATPAPGPSATSATRQRIPPPRR